MLYEHKNSNKKGWGIASVFVLVVCNFVRNSDQFSPVGRFFLILLLLGVIVFGFYIANILDKRFMPQWQEAELAAQQAQEEAQKIYQASYKALSFLPEEYQYPLATGYLVKMVMTNRASTLAEALNLYDEQLHRWRIENAYEQMLAQQQEQANLLRDIDANSQVAAVASTANTIFNFVRKL